MRPGKFAGPGLSRIQIEGAQPKHPALEHRGIVSLSTRERSAERTTPTAGPQPKHPFIKQLGLIPAQPEEWPRRAGKKTLEGW
jgi:hypothetical protein